MGTVGLAVYPFWEWLAPHAVEWRAFGMLNETAQASCTAGVCGVCSSRLAAVGDVDGCGCGDGCGGCGCDGSYCGRTGGGKTGGGETDGSETDGCKTGGGKTDGGESDCGETVSVRWMAVGRWCFW